MRTLLLTFAGLMGLLLLTTGAYFIPMGVGNLVANLLIAAAKAALIAVFFMRLKSQSALIHVAAVMGLFWLVLMFWLTLNDYLTRVS
jgi:cytochrome c oxidase subunit 4